MNADNTSTSAPRDDHGDTSASGHFHPKRRKGGKTWPWVLTALVCVVSGVVIGAGLTILHYKDKTIPRPPPTREMAEHILKHVNSTVNLTGGENERVQAIIQNHMESVRQIRRESWQSIGKQFDAMNQDVGEVLGPERRRKWQEAVEKRWPKRKRRSDSDRDSRSGHRKDNDSRPH